MSGGVNVLCLLAATVTYVKYLMRSPYRPISTIDLPDISLFEKLIWKSRRTHNEKSVRGAGSGTPYGLAKIEYCYSGKENLWYGSWNPHVCRKGKCAADCPSRSTGVDPRRKQRSCSPPCLLFQDQRDTSDKDNSQNRDFSLAIRHRFIDMWSWMEMVAVAFQWRADCMNSTSYEYRNMSSRRGV